MSYGQPSLFQAPLPRVQPFRLPRTRLLLLLDPSEFLMLGPNFLFFDGGDFLAARFRICGLDLFEGEDG